MPVICTNTEPCGENYLNSWEIDLVAEADPYGVVIALEQYERVWREGTEGPREPRRLDDCYLNEDGARKLRDLLSAFLESKGEE